MQHRSPTLDLPGVTKRSSKRELVSPRPSPTRVCLARHDRRLAAQPGAESTGSCSCTVSRPVTGQAGHGHSSGRVRHITAECVGRCPAANLLPGKLRAFPVTLASECRRTRLFPRGTVRTANDRMFFPECPWGNCAKLVADGLGGPGRQASKNSTQRLGGQEHGLLLPEMRPRSLLHVLACPSAPSPPSWLDPWRPPGHIDGTTATPNGKPQVRLQPRARCAFWTLSSRAAATHLQSLWGAMEHGPAGPLRPTSTDGRSTRRREMAAHQSQDDRAWVALSRVVVGHSHPHPSQSPLPDPPPQARFGPIVDGTRPLPPGWTPGRRDGADLEGRIPLYDVVVLVYNTYCPTPPNPTARPVPLVLSLSLSLSLPLSLSPAVCPSVHFTRAGGHLEPPPCLRPGSPLCLYCTVCTNERSLQFCLGPCWNSRTLPHLLRLAAV